MNRYGRSSAQVMIRWSLQRGFVCVPKSSNRERIAQNARVFDFHISDEDMQKLVRLKGILYCIHDHLFLCMQNGLDEHFIADWPGIMMTSWEP